MTANYLPLLAVNATRGALNTPLSVRSEGEIYAPNRQSRSERSPHRAIRMGRQAISTLGEAAFPKRDPSPIGPRNAADSPKGNLPLAFLLQLRSTRHNRADFSASTSPSRSRRITVTRWPRADKQTLPNADSNQVHALSAATQQRGTVDEHPGL